MAEYSILDFGAVGDNTTDSTDAINSTIEKASSEGGGTVRVPYGAFRSGTIFLKDNVRLDLSHADLHIHGIRVRARKIGPEFPDLPIGSARNIPVSNFTATDAGSYGGSITGFPGHYVENVTL